MPVRSSCFFNDTATTEIYTLSLHDALPISTDGVDPTASSGNVYSGPFQISSEGTTTVKFRAIDNAGNLEAVQSRTVKLEDRKSTRLNSSHANISYAVFCLKKKKQPPLCSPT